MTTNSLAVRLGVAASSAWGMVHGLADVGFVGYEPYRGVRLTVSGSQVAPGVLLRRRPIELYPADASGRPWAYPHDAQTRRPTTRSVSDRAVRAPAAGFRRAAGASGQAGAGRPAP